MQFNQLLPVNIEDILIWYTHKPTVMQLLNKYTFVCTRRPDLITKTLIISDTLAYCSFKPLSYFKPSTKDMQMQTLVT